MENRRALCTPNFSRQQWPVAISTRQVAAKKDRWHSTIRRMVGLPYEVGATLALHTAVKSFRQVPDGRRREVHVTVSVIAKADQAEWLHVISR